MKKSLIKEVESIELHHKLRAFILIVALTIIITRLLVLIEDPNLIIKGYELHHFYYGIALLVVLTIFRIFSDKHKNLYLNLSAISIGLIIDEFLFVMGNMKGTEQYVQTLPSAIVFIIIISIITILTDYLTKKK